MFRKAPSTEAQALDAVLNLTEMVQEQSFTSMATFFDDLFTAYSKNFTAETVPDSIESTYTGVHLNQAYEENDFEKMITSFKNGNILHAKYAVQILRDAISAFEKYPNVPECRLNTSSCIVVGDLHGSFKDLYYLIQRYGTPGKLNRFVFNGDFVDRGPQQIEVLLTLLYAHLMYPTKVYLNRGNHEDLSINLSKHFNPNFKSDVDNKYGKFSLAIFNNSQRLFRRLPVATIVENNAGYRAFVTHGGLSNRVDLNYIKSKQFNRSLFPSVSVKSDQDPVTKRMAEQFSDLIWSDPIKSTMFKAKTGCYPNDARGAGFFFANDVSESFCKKNGFNMVIRSHEVRDEGFSQDHSHCCTVFSSSFYAGGSNKAAVVVLEPNKSGLQTHKFKTNHLSSDAYESLRVQLLKGFKSYLNRESGELYPLLNEQDKNNEGWLSYDKWSTILSKYVKTREGVLITPAHFLALKDYLCPCDEVKRRAQYSAMFKSLFKRRESKSLFEFLGVVFNLIDIDKNGKISAHEARRAIELLNAKMGTQYGTEFISRMDTNGDGVIDIHEFKTGFARAFNL
jgi:hypothetical protein